MTDLETFLQSGVPGMKVTFAGLLSAGVTLLVCLLAVRLLTKLARRLVGRTRLDGRVQKYLLLALRLVLYAVAVIIVLGELHVDASSLVALLWASRWRRRTFLETPRADCCCWGPIPSASGTSSSPTACAARWRRLP